MKIAAKYFGIIVLLFFGGCAAPGESMQPLHLQSGLQPGDSVVPWNPIHVVGPNAGTNACPVCTYEARPAVLIFAKDQSDAAALAPRLETLLADQQPRDLKGFIIVLNSNPAHLKAMGDELKIVRAGICYPDPVSREQDLKSYKINASAANTIMVYKDYKVAANFVNLDANDFGQVAAAVTKLH